MILKSIAFFGCSCGKAGDAHYDSAYETAKLVAGSGRRVVNGGGPGVMLAATEGAEEVDGDTTVVYYRPELASKFEGKDHGNIADKAYEESNYILRTKKLLELSDAFIVFNGGTGTISEFAMAWGIARLYIDHHKPLILFGDYWRNIMDAFEKNMLIRPDEKGLYTIVSTPTEAISALEKYEKSISKSGHPHKSIKSSEEALRL